MPTTAQTVKRLSWRDLIKVDDATPADTIKALDAYFEPFAEVRFEDADKKSGVRCIECNGPMTGLVSFMTGGGFTWGLAHGEGHCARCKWPARGHHYIKDENGEDVLSIRNFPLSYHPDFVSKEDE